ncbi:MAG: hypothetical protein ACM3S1_06580 [Hyphomicrobiales bacterium]
MKKRLFAAFLIVGAISATMVLGASAFWTTQTGTAQVTANAGTADLTVAGCELSSGCDTTLTYDGIYPGWSTTQNNIVVENSGDIPLRFVVDVDGGSGTLESALILKVQCGTGSAEGTLQQWDAGVTLGTLNPGASTSCNATLSFPDSGSNQNGLQGKSANFTVKIYGTSQS